MGEQNDKYRCIFVIPIVGMGGVGKTALAQAVYNKDEVQKTFESRAWTSVSNNLDLLSVMGRIYESFPKYPPSDLANRSLQSISDCLSSLIQGKKFLIVLDDMFESHWDLVYEILSNGAPGSVVLITTQDHVFANRIVNSAAGPVCPIALSPLEWGEFWALFKHFAFGKVLMSEEKRKALKPIGKIIAEKLCGLPLAAKIIGNVLNSGLNEHIWSGISKSEWWDVQEGQSKILPSVRLGYEQLNPSLQQCFAYCSLFPRNSLIDKNRLVHMWIAHNFIQDVKGVKRLEDIGSQWFDELVKKSFFQLSGDNKSYVMHELMHDLAVIVSSSECFYLGDGVVKIPLGIRHLAVDTTNLEAIKGIKEHKSLRTFLYFVRCQVKGMYTAIQDTLSNLDSIRVLDLSFMHMEYNYKPPPAIWDLEHLRFLDLSFTGITVLTRSSMDLYHLQALYIRKCNFKELPKGINKLINLRHLCAEEKTIVQISGIGQLTNLQELGVFVVGKEEGHRITELENLREIGGSLTIKHFQNIKNKDEAKLANLVNKKHLDRIQIIRNNTNRNSNEDMEVLQELQPNKDIKDLRINNYGGLDFPNWINKIGDHFLVLDTLCLVSCGNVKVLPPLGELPSLKRLQIEKFDSVKLIDSHFNGKKQTVFPLLELLVLDTLSNCEGWTVARATEFCPRLSKLTIAYMQTLREAPLHLFRSSLKEFKISECNSLISLGDSIPNLSSITHLNLSFISASISLDPLNMPLLENLDLYYCWELKCEGHLQSLTRLKHLKLVKCSKFFSRDSTMDQQKGKAEGLLSLTHIEADYSLFDHEYHLILRNLPSLRVLKVDNSELTGFTNDQVKWFEELTTLKETQFHHCKFEHLPASLTLLSDIMPLNLRELSLICCSPNLVQLCQAYKAYKGQDWQFTSSIPVIHMDDDSIRHNVQISDAHQEQTMEIRKPQISNEIGRQACVSCGKTFERRDWVIY